jgi:hypothetical protein
MQDLLRRINLNDLAMKAKKMLRKMHGKDDGDEDRSMPPDEKQMDRMDMVKPGEADSGRGLSGEEGG